MFAWGAFTLFLYMFMRTSGFVLFSPIFGRNGIPGLFQGGFIGMLAMCTFFVYGGSAPVPDNLLTFSFRLLSELGIGLVLSLIMRFFFYIAEQGGELVDSQMGMSMAKTYDPSSQSQMSVTGSVLNLMMLLLFFAENGHITLLRLMISSGEVVPYGSASFGQHVADYSLEMFANCALLALKLCLPILGAELLGQVGMGVLMKVIPQINVFAINIELKVIIGLVMLMLLISPMSEFLLQVELDMLRAMRSALGLMAGG